MILSIKNLTKKYNDKVILDSINLEIEQGDFYAFLGQNGAGKTTTISIMTDLVRKDSGKIKIMDIDIDDNFSLAKKHVGVIPQEFNFFVFGVVFDIVCDQAGLYGIKKDVAKKRTEFLLKKLHLWDKRNSKARELSGGMKRRLMIARELVHNPKILILDEPTAGVDVEIRNEMWKFLKELNNSGTTILLTTHYLEEAENLCNKLAVISNGKIVKQGKMKDFINKFQHDSYLINIEKTSEKINTKSFNLIDENTLQVQISENKDLYYYIEILKNLNIKIKSIKTKKNALEEILLSS